MCPEVGGTAARVSWASAGTGRCGKRRVTWFIMVGIVWLLVAHQDLYRICRGFSWNQLFATHCFRETAYQAPTRSDESYAVALQVREACAAEAEPLDPGSRMWDVPMIQDVSGAQFGTSVWVWFVFLSSHLPFKTSTLGHNLYTGIIYVYYIFDVFHSLIYNIYFV